jgi:hypothetical protein
MAKNAGDALRAAIRELVDPDGPDDDDIPEGYPGLLALFGSNAAIAAAAGFPTAKSVVDARRLRYPKGRPQVTARKAAEAKRARGSFLRALQRYARGQPLPAGRVDLIERLRDEKLAEIDSERTMAGVEGLIGERRHLTVFGGALHFYDTYDGRERGPFPDVQFDISEELADLIEAEEWARAGKLFFVEWGRAYGRGVYGFDVEDVEGLEIEVGDV